MFDRIRNSQWKEKLLRYHAEATECLLSILASCFNADPEKRIDSTAIITHPFFQQVNNQYKSLKPAKVMEVFMSCRHFKPRFFFQKEVLRHMVSRFLNHREKDFLRKIFDALDDEKDGELTANEFCDQFKAKFNLELPYKEMRKIIRCIDFADGGDGLI